MFKIRIPRKPDAMCLYRDRDHSCIPRQHRARTYTCWPVAWCDHHSRWLKCSQVTKTHTGALDISLCFTQKVEAGVRASVQCPLCFGDLTDTTLLVWQRLLWLAHIFLLAPWFVLINGKWTEGMWVTPGLRQLKSKRTPLSSLLQLSAMEPRPWHRRSEYEKHERPYGEEPHWCALDCVLSKTYSIYYIGPLRCGELVTAVGVP